MSPTEMAHDRFQRARYAATHAMNQSEEDYDPRFVAISLQDTADGLMSMATGLHLTYKLLEEVKDLLQRQKVQLGGRP